MGDPVWPAPTHIDIPLLLGGSIELCGYPLDMVRAEKIVTAIQRGIANTRWRDFADIYLLSRRHEIATAATPIEGMPYQFHVLTVTMSPQAGIDEPR